MEEAFVAYLLGASALTAIVSDRITWATRPQADAVPAICLHNITSNPVYADEGFSGLTSSRIQIDIWGVTYAQVKDISRKVTDRLSGGTASFTQSGIEFQVAFKQDEQDSFEQGNASEELYRVRLDFDIWFK